ncbi:hypothetical protein C3L33_01187, partial [Rhododendron williamsianum]
MASIFNSLPLIFSIFIILLIVLSSAGGFTVDLIHRDSPKSPFYDPSASRTDRLTNAVRRSFTRAASHSRKQNCLAPNNIQSEIIPASGEYLMKISIGTPRFQVLVIADTGSDLTWTQCKPCKNCYKQKAPLFDPKQSSTYRALSAQRALVKPLVLLLRVDRIETFVNTARATGTSPSAGETLRWRLSLSGPVRARLFPFNQVLLLLGRPRIESTSKIKFGEDAVVSGKGVVSTPILKKEVDTFYYLTLESISTMEDELVKAINKKNTADPQQFFSLCYSDTSIVPPALTFNFKGGAKVVLPPSSTFVLNGDLLCLAMIPTNDLAIFGNLSQMNFLIGYDLEKSVLSFKPTDCDKHKISFGEDAVVSGEGVVSTPIVKKEVDTFYYLTLESITVGNKSLAYKAKQPSGAEPAYSGEEGNIIIDSGTTLTFLPADLYEAMENELVKAINKETTPDPQQSLRLCYDSNTNVVDLPALTFNFRGAEVVCRRRAASYRMEI